jgi:hypothetical protein
MNCRMNVFTLLTNVCFTVETPELDVLSFHKVKKALANKPCSSGFDLHIMIQAFASLIRSQILTLVILGFLLV